MLKSSIVDTRVRLIPSQKLLKFLDKHKEHFHDVPENVANIMKQKGYSLPLGTKITKDHKTVLKRPKIDYELLGLLTADVDDSVETPVESNLPGDEDGEKPPAQHKSVLYLEDIHWLNDTLDELRKTEVCEVFLHELIETCDLILPENEFKPRNPDLEARCQRLREEQHNREYQKMTKNVDAGLKNYPEDTIAYQIKSLNKQIIAVVQFIFSVAAGFTFGFFGVNLMVGPLPFGFRILLGVIVALIIALAEMYFLAKKLHEYDEVLDAPKRKQPQPATPPKRPVQAKASGVQTLKPHAD
ncbi:uncharacterized protein Dana_GF18081 [Drosophila ananassae]|uniref:Transmembrane protein 199 n=1 Tax=Drosophila ananassae TaxID=7217 RepID=B3LVP0_DROAN|nr:transmembrane protein 199 [Drosophila ananassae]EDV42610.1 uncharacterized protein Dana_GF18081 [Drosophila ananassae]